MTATTKTSSRPAPIVDFERIEETYTELKKMEVVLDPNPIEYGPKRFSNRIAQVRAMLNRVEQIFLQTSEDLHYFKRLINARRSLYELEKRELMINDPRCRVGRSQQEREALADVQLRKQIEVIQKLELAALDLETVMISIKSKRTDLKDVQGRMRDQMRLIEHDLGMGARWGGNAPPSSASATVEEINNLLATVDQGFGIVDGEDVAEDGEDVAEDGEDVAEDGEDVAEDGEDVAEDGEDVAEDGEEPAEEPVLVFGEDEEVVLPEEGSEGELPEVEHAQDEADNFLDALSTSTSDEEPAGEDEEDDEDGDAGIDSLIASLTDD